VCHAQATLSVSERRACRVVGQCQAAQQYVPTQTDDEGRLRTRIIALGGSPGLMRIGAFSWSGKRISLEFGLSYNLY
jgi:hypothetical protein